MELKPCPFCGSDNVSSEGVVESSKGQVHCHDCGASGPNPVYDTIDPQPNWNTRQPVTIQEADNIGLLRKALEKGEIDRVLTGLSVAVDHEILRGETAERVEMARDDYHAMVTLVDAARIVAAPDEGAE